MKILVFLLIAGLPALASAQTQQAQPLLNAGKAGAQSPSGILDTTRMYSSKYGKVARLTQDNMPCIIPYGNARVIPNASKGKKLPNDIPNAWGNNIPNVWKKDSMSLQMIPEKKK